MRSLPPVVCRRVHALFIVVSNTYCVVFFVLFWGFLRLVASFSGLSIFDCPSIFSNVYLIIKQHKKTKRDDCGPQTCFGTCFR